MKKAISFILCIIMIFLCVSCDNVGNGAASSSQAPQSDPVPSGDESGSTSGFADFGKYRELGTGTFDRKKVLIIGNSFTYYGGLVENSRTVIEDGTDKGMFYTLCQLLGEDVYVYDRTFGGHYLRDFGVDGCKCVQHHGLDGRYSKFLGCPGIGEDLLAGIDLYDIDCVFMAEAGLNTEDFVESALDVKARFTNPKTKFVIMGHHYLYQHGYTTVTDGMQELKKYGFLVMEPGKLENDLVNKNVSVPGGTFSYNWKTFANDRYDNFHPSPICGYISAVMCYCTVSGRSCVGLPYEFGDTVYTGDDMYGLTKSYDAFIGKYYTSPDVTNFKQIMNSETEIRGLQQLMDEYIAESAKETSGEEEKRINLMENANPQISDTYGLITTGSNYKPEIMWDGKRLYSGSSGGFCDFKFASSSSAVLNGNIPKYNLDGKTGLEDSIYLCLFRIALDRVCRADGIRIYGSETGVGNNLDGFDLFISETGLPGSWTKVFSDTGMVCGQKYQRENSTAYIEAGFDTANVRYLAFCVTQPRCAHADMLASLGIRQTTAFNYFRLTEIELFGKSEQ